MKKGHDSVSLTRSPNSRMRYSTESEVEDVVSTFEDASIARGKWTHVEHLAVALHDL